MSVYLTTLFFAIPIFGALILVEIIAAKIKGVKISNAPDTISSLSSGMTDVIQSAVKFSVVIISYAWLVDKITIYKLEPIWLAILFAFIVEDFAGYWMHRLHHRVNLFWNRHVIHHSSEEFNLPCALRQTISTTFRFSAILMIPAALVGIPASIFAILTPVHLFMQFWYHTRLIDKMGVLEHILVTPSHHRVHHAINPEYLDKNYSQIFIIWDKLFNTFQPELKDVKPVYGTLRPAATWNPVIINYKHVWQLIKDAWRTKRLIDKIQIWFRPTGWRPQDVQKKFPLKEVQNPYKQIKYATENSPELIIWTWVQFIITQVMIFHLFMVAHIQGAVLNYLYAAFLVLNIFSFTSTLDRSKYVIPVELVKLIFAIGILFYQNYNWFGLEQVVSAAIFIYLIISVYMTYYFNVKIIKYRSA